MKSITKLMVVAMLLVAALVVAPVAATRSGPGAKEISSGDTVYVGEEGLKFVADFGGNSGAGYNITRLIYFSGDTAGQSIPVVKGSHTAPLTLSEFDVSKALATTTGTYYAFNDTVTVDKKNAAGTVDIRVPNVNLGVVLNNSEDDRIHSVDGKSVTRSADLIFELDTNLAVGFKGSTAPTMNIEVTLPGGGVVTEFKNAILTDVKINETTKFYTDNFSLAGATAGTYTAIAKWPEGTDFYDKGYDSNSVSFEVLTKALAIATDKDSVVRGNSFTVTVTGESLKNYWVRVKSGDAKSPLIAPGQTAIPNYGLGDEWNRTIRTNAGGNAVIQFNTSSTGTKTGTGTFTIEVVDPDPKTDNTDEVKVKVEKGSVTITTSGTGTYYIGEEITFSGTCTDGDEVYLFITGPNLGDKGANLTHLGPVTSNDPGSFTKVDVEADDTWSRKWSTISADLGAIDAGSYTIYAVSEAKGKGDLSDARYALTSINLRTGFLRVDPIGAVAKGDDLKIAGTAEGNPDNVYIWIFGKNYYGGDSNKLNVESVSVESDNSFSKKIKTDDLAAGQYFVIIQHPMGVDEVNAGSFTNVAGSIGWDTNGNVGRNVVGAATSATLTKLQAPAAASALVDILESANIPDTYVKLTFFVDEAYLFIDSIGTKEAGSKFTITGTTNLAVGGTLNVEVTSAAFQPGEKGAIPEFTGVADTVVIEKGDGGVNKWSFEVDATGFKPDQYIVTVDAIEAKKTNSATFNMVEAGEAPATTPPAGETTTPPAGETTTPPAGETTTPTEPAPTPGFGALVALAGLGAVAFLVLRRK